MPTGVYERSEKEKARLRLHVSLFGFKKGVKHKNVWNKGTNNSGMLGKKHTLETRKRMSEVQSGHNAPAWKGGVSTKNELARKNGRYKEWRNRVYARDDWTCQDCGARSKIEHRVVLHAHHIKPFAENKKERYCVNNGITLCERCHKNRHKKH